MKSQLHHLGMNMIRPLPPPREFARLPLPYGQCVDMFYNDVWWEGVIFDRKEGDEERRIYFPHMGDEQGVEWTNLRVSQDWNEVTEEWESHASWIFLEVIEEIEQLYPLLILVKQICMNIVEDGFLGSWNLGTMIGCDDLFHQVKYDHIMPDHGFDNLALPPPREFARLPLPLWKMCRYALAMMSGGKDDSKTQALDVFFCAYLEEIGEGSCA
ncbi:hypothetical protein HAX54_044926 [Datura stramonium]|uniref:Agenet domain-containing protein n=1 Tax=Datura stramonium TaxID=4076 RepID=A0ABS8SQ22_DATST|nr:hypothetical protein [Datura stramonium]